MKLADTDIIIDKELLKKIKEKKNRLDALRPIPKDILKKLLEEIRIRHTYHSDAIDGNTLTLKETKLVIEESVGPTPNDQVDPSVELYILSFESPKLVPAIYNLSLNTVIIDALNREAKLNCDHQPVGLAFL